MVVEQVVVVVVMVKMISLCHVLDYGSGSCGGNFGDNYDCAK